MERYVWWQHPWMAYEKMGPWEQTCKSPPIPPTQEQDIQTESDSWEPFCVSFWLFCIFAVILHLIVDIWCLFYVAFWSFCVFIVVLCLFVVVYHWFLVILCLFFLLCCVSFLWFHISYCDDVGSKNCTWTSVFCAHWRWREGIWSDPQWHRFYTKYYSIEKY